MLREGVSPNANFIGDRQQTHHFHSLCKQGRESMQFLVLSASVGAGQGREGLGPGQIPGMLPSELARGGVHCPGSWILILMPLFSGSVTLAVLPSPLSLAKMRRIVS